MFRLCHQSLSRRNLLLCAATPTPTRASWAAESSSSTSTWGMATSSEQHPASSSSSTDNRNTILKLSPDIDSVLEVVRQDAGETAKYYADKYFDV